MDTTRGILFLVVTLIIIVSIYYIVKMVKGKRTPTQPSPSPSDQTDEISISDLKFERTLNPDKGNSKGGDIVGYIIEYDEGDGGIDYDKLSKNVTFTLGWKNNIGFTDKVTGFNIEHYVKDDDDDTAATFTAKQSIDFKNENATVVNIKDFGTNSVSIVSDGNYSVVGKNRFKISVIMNNNDEKLLYNGLEQTGDGHEIEISEQELGATLDMLEPQTVTYTPVTQSFTTSKVDIAVNKYWIYNDDTNLNIGDEFIYLIPATSGNTLAYDAADKDVDTFYFKYEDGDYLLQDLTKDKWNKKTDRDKSATVFDAYDNRMFVSFYNKDGNTTELRKVHMGFGVGTHSITSKDGILDLMSTSSTDSVDETEFKNSKWTFVDTKEMKCGDTIRLNRLKDGVWKFCKFNLGTQGGTIFNCGTVNFGLNYENATKWKITKIDAGEDGSGYTLTSTFDYDNTTYYLEVIGKILFITTDKIILKKSDFKDVQSNNRFFCDDKYMRIDMIDYISNME